MQLSETMKDILKQLCIFEKQLAKYTKEVLGIFLYNKKWYLELDLIMQSTYILTSLCLSKLHMYFCTYLVLQLSKI